MGTVGEAHKCGRCGEPMQPLVTHRGVCRGEAGCTCPGTSYDCQACRLAHPPAMKSSGKRVVVVPSFDVLRAAGWKPPAQRCVPAAPGAAPPSALRLRIRAARRDRGWSQAELGRRVGKSQALISLWETGRVAIEAAIGARLWRVVRGTGKATRAVEQEERSA